MNTDTTTIKEYYLEEMRTILEHAFNCEMPQAFQDLTAEQVTRLANILLYDGFSNFSAVVFAELEIRLKINYERNSITPERIQIIFMRLRNLYPSRL